MSPPRYWLHPFLLEEEEGQEQRREGLLEYWHKHVNTDSN